MQTFLNAQKLLSGYAKNFVTLQLFKLVKFYLTLKCSRKHGINMKNLC